MFTETIMRSEADDSTAKRAADAESAIHVRNAVARDASELGLQPSEAEILISLLSDPHQSVGRIANRLAHRPQTVSNALRRLEVKGLVKREPGKGDRRERLQSLTREGSRLALDILTGERRDLATDDGISESPPCAADRGTDAASNDSTERSHHR